MKPYIYKATHTETNQFYIGFRFANTVPADKDIGVLYFSSSAIVKSMGVENFQWEVIAEFDSVDQAFYFENYYIRECRKNKLCLNLRYLDVDACGEKLHKFIRHNRDISEETRKKSSASHTGKKHTDETRALQKEKAKAVWSNPERRAEVTRKAEIRRAIREKEKAEFILTFVGPVRPVGLGRVWTDEKRARQREVIKIARESTRGKPLSDETKRKLSEAIKGKPQRKRTPEEKAHLGATRGKPIIVYGMKYNNAVDAQNKLGISREKLTRMAKDPDNSDVTYV